MEEKKEKKGVINFDEMPKVQPQKPYYLDVVIYPDGTTNRKDLGPTKQESTDK